MHRGIELLMPGERSRNKELLEASVAWLWELEELRERQQSLVLTALALGGESGGCSMDPEEWAFRRRLDHLQDAPSALMQVLQQQFNELRVDTCDQSAEDDLDSPSSSGFYEQSETHSPPRRSSSSPSLSFSSHRPRSVDAYMWDWEGQREPTPRAVLPRSFSAPYPPLEGIAEGTEEEEEEDDVEDGALWSEDHIVNEDEMDPTEEEDEGPIEEVDEDPTVEVNRGPTEEVDEGPVEEVDDSPTTEDIQQAMRVESYILGLLQRCSLNPTASSSTGLGFPSNHWQDLHAYAPNTPSYCGPTPGHSDWQDWSGLNDEEEDGGEEPQEGYYMSHLNAQDGAPSLRCDDPESSLEMEQYGTVEPCSSSSDVDSLRHQRGYLEHHRTELDHITSSHYIHSRMSLSPPLTPQSADQEWASRLSRMHQEERWSSVEERRDKTTRRSQSEGSFQPQGWAVQPEHRYYTVGRDRGGHCDDEEYLSNQRVWSSTADLSQEEEEPSLRGEEPVTRYARLPVHTLPDSCIQYTEQSQHLINGTKARASQADGSDSSLSETCSPRSSSVSSDSDESAGLVWPQQLPPRLPTSSQDAPSTVVKIKASHALKRKIMRFRSGSLKVMTTV
ncbi:uncharacterized protein dact3b [Salminus brasiliensis]|uniref:uncharacterized protein dact3b n=1 Tax=Salminus brasiliensis TaxID=930266 RepID=UPI003B83323F